KIAEEAPNCFWFSRTSSSCMYAKMNGPRLYSCSKCRRSIAFHDDIISKAFQGKKGRAYLFTDVSRVELGPKVDRPLLTGLHMVSDIKCSNCHELLGWKFTNKSKDTHSSTCFLKGFLKT
ncbi:hypothetical protein GOP47_0023473, partial [Adiantum capillus-veneris]